DNASNNESCVSITYMVNALDVSDVVLNSSNLSIYPNPASTHLNVKYDFGGGSADAASILIKDLAGKVVYYKELGENTSGVQNHSLDISNLNAGLYLVELHADNQKVVNKFVVQ